jgi:hypothetical protein
MSVASFFEEWNGLAYESCPDGSKKHQYALLTNVELHLIEQSRNVLKLLWISAPQGSGKGTEALELLCSTADKHGVTLKLTSVSSDPAYQQRLNDWYTRHLFTSKGSDNRCQAMTRKPQPALLRYSSRFCK